MGRVQLRSGRNHPALQRVTLLRSITENKKNGITGIFRMNNSSMFIGVYSIDTDATTKWFAVHLIGSVRITRCILVTNIKPDLYYTTQVAGLLA